MTATILHGDDVDAIEKFILQAEQVLQDKKLRVVRLDLLQDSLLDVELFVSQSGLFGSDQALLLSGLSTLKDKASQQRLAELLATSDLKMLLINRSPLGKQILNVLSSALADVKIIEKKLPKYVFSWVEKFGVSEFSDQQQLLNKALSQESAEFAFAMLLRQSRFWVEQQVLGNSSAPPFAKRTIVKQVQTFSGEGVLDLYRVLCMLDLSQKSSTMSLRMSTVLSGLQLFPKLHQANQKKE